jgi:hypoxanthine phosphoribosyltransferase
VTVAHRVVADADGVRRRVAELGVEIARRHDGERAHDGVVVVGVLKGSVPFVADLSRSIPVPVLVDFVAVSSYRPDAGRVRLVKDLSLDVTDRAVVLAHDVVHTGLTTAYLVGELRRRGARSVDVCALVDRSASRVVPVEVDLAGFHVGDEYVVGMGLDHRGRYRNLGGLVAVDEGALDADPDALVGDLYGRRAGVPGAPRAGQSEGSRR